LLKEFPRKSEVFRGCQKLTKTRLTGVQAATDHELRLLGECGFRW